MTAVWIFFVVGVLVVLAGLVPAVIEAFAFLYAYITTTKELLAKKKELRKEKIAALKAKKDAEEAEVEKVAEEVVAEEVKTVEEAVETPVAEEPVVAEPVAEAPINTTELAHDILGTM